MTALTSLPPFQRLTVLFNICMRKSKAKLLLKVLSIWLTRQAFNISYVRMRWCMYIRATKRNARQIRILLRPTLYIQRDANSKYDPNGVG
jgi:hypothetical protein